MVLEQIALYRGEFARAQFDLERVHADLVAQKTLLDNADKVDVPDIEVMQIVQNDPAARQVQQELTTTKMEAMYEKQTAKPGSHSPFVGQSSQRLKNLQEEYDALVDGIRKQVQAKKRSLIETEWLKLKATYDTMVEQQKKAGEKIKEMTEQAKEFGRTSVAVEMLRSDIKNLESVLGSFSSEREKLRVEINAPARITLLAAGGGAVGSFQYDYPGGGDELWDDRRALLSGVFHCSLGHALASHQHDGRRFARASVAGDRLDAADTGEGDSSIGFAVAAVSGVALAVDGVDRRDCGPTVAQGGGGSVASDYGIERDGGRR